MLKKIAPALIVATLAGLTALPAAADDLRNALGGALGGAIASGLAASNPLAKCACMACMLLAGLRAARACIKVWCSRKDSSTRPDFNNEL